MTVNGKKKKQKKTLTRKMSQGKFRMKSNLSEP